GTLKRIDSLTKSSERILSIAWGPDDRIYSTVEETMHTDPSNAFTRTRIASIKPDGTEPIADWSAESNHSYAYPVLNGTEILYSRFSLNGKEQTLWARNPETPDARQIADSAWRAVWLDSEKLYYIYQKNLHLRFLESGQDLTILNSVDQADYR